MTNRLFAVLYLLAGLWIAILYAAVEFGGGHQYFLLVLLLGLPPLIVIGIVHYVMYGRP